MSGLRPWLPHLLLVTVMAATLVQMSDRRRTVEELTRSATEGAPLERIAALHILSSRPDADEQRFGMPLVQRLVEDEDPRLVEFAGTINPCRFGEITFLEQRLLRPPVGDIAAWFRQFVFYRRKVGGKQVGGRRRLNLQELSWMLDALAGREIPNADVLQYVQNRESGLPAKFERDRQEGQ